MKFRKKIGFGIACLIVLSMVLALSMIFIKGPSNSDNKDILVLIAEGKGASIYANQTTIEGFEDTDRNLTYDLELTSLSSDLYSEKDKEVLIDRFLGKNRTRTYEIPYEETYRANASCMMLSLREDGSCAYADSYEYGEMKYSELLTDEKLIEKASRVLTNFKVNRSELRLRRISNSIDEVEKRYGSGTANTFWVQLLIFDQYIEGIRVSGGRGNVIIAFGKGDRLIHLEDNTLKYEKVVKQFDSMRSVNETLKDLSQKEIGSKAGSVKVTRCELVFFVQTEMVQPWMRFKSCYEIELCPLDPINGESEILRCET